MNESYSRRLLKGTNVNKERGAGSIIEVGASANAREIGVNAFNMEERAPAGIFVGRVMWGPGSTGYDQTSVKVYGLIKVYIPKFSGIHSSESPGFEDAPNWITCYPVMPFAGSDVGPDGLGSSYGMHYVPRVGDFVTVAFPDGDPSIALWLGCVSPSMDRRFGLPDAPASRVDGEDQRLPAGESPEDTKPAQDLTAQTKESGLGADQLRGSTPPQDKIDNKVMGWRSYGDRATKRAGHSFLMYDDPAVSMLRLRSGAGGQFIINDAANFIYMNTQSGRAWAELGDDGHIDIYGAKSISVHAVEDLNLTAGRDLNVDVGRDVNYRIGGKALGEIGAGYGLTVTGDGKAKISGDYNLISGGDSKVSAAAYNVTASSALRLTASTIDAGATGNVKINSSAGSIYEQGGATAASAPTDPEKVKTTTVPGEPTRDEYTRGSAGADRTTIAGRDGNARVPMHEPWDPGRSRTPAAPTSTERGDGTFPTFNPTQFSKNPNLGNPTTGPRNYRNNNPANVKTVEGGWVGQTGIDPVPALDDGYFAVFGNPIDGFRAQTYILNNYPSKGYRTTRQIINRWANTPGGSYVDDVAAAAGVDPDEDITSRWGDPDFRFKFQKAMIVHEGGSFSNEFKESDLAAGLVDGGVTRQGSGDSIVGSIVKFVSSRLSTRGGGS